MTKLSKRETALTMLDGGTVEGNLKVDGTLTVAGTSTHNGATVLNGNVDIGNAETDTVGFFGKTKLAYASLIVSGGESARGLGDNNDDTYHLTGSAGNELINVLSTLGIISGSTALQGL